jgi:hypothetical protein
MKRLPLRRQLEQQQFKGGSTDIASAPTPTPAPPVTADDPSVIAAEQDVAQANLLKKSVKKTMLAGDTAWAPGQTGGPGTPPGSPSSYRKNIP